jgi:enoyl-CoA hydratase/carnithine racemase
VTGGALALRDAALRLRDPAALETFSPVGAEPLLAVEVDAATGAEDAVLAAALARLPAPSVALLRDRDAPAARHCAALFDLVVSSEDELACVAAAVRATPIAAAALAQLLRHGDARSIEAGLVAESLAYSTLQAGPEFRAWLATHPAPVPRAEAGAPLRARREGASLHLGLDRPAKRNAYSAALRDALVEVLQLALQDDSIERVLIDAEGPAFCAGGDLDEFGTLPDPATAHAIRTTRSAARLLAQVAERTEVHLHGACVGAGIELAAFAGRIVARTDAWFALPERAMGLLPGAGGTVSLPRRIGRQRTAWLALSGARIDATTALEWGLVDAIA